jgi:hypothetical protein
MDHGSDIFHLVLIRNTTCIVLQKRLYKKFVFLYYRTLLVRKRFMMFRKFARFLNILCIVIYLPVVLGSGECVALCFEPDGSLALDYTHRCCIADYSSKPVDVAEMKGIFSPASFTEPVHSPACRDIPLIIGNHTHFAPEINYSLFPVLTFDEFPVTSDKSFISIPSNCENILFRYPPAFQSPYRAGNSSVLII